MKNRITAAAKAYLQRAEKLGIIIDQKRQLQQDLRERAVSISSGSQSSPGGHSVGRAKYENLMIKVADLEAEISEGIVEIEREKLKITNDIQKLDNPIYVRLLYMRYIEGKKLSRIADEIGYSFDRIRHLHGLALLAFADIMKVDTQKHIS